MNDLHFFSPPNNKRVSEDVSLESYKPSSNNSLKLESVQYLPSSVKKRGQVWAEPRTFKSPPPRIELVMDLDHEQLDESFLSHSFNSGFRGLGVLRSSDNRENSRKRFSLTDRKRDQPKNGKQRDQQKRSSDGPTSIVTKPFVESKSSEEFNEKGDEDLRGQGPISPTAHNVITRNIHLKDVRTRKILFKEGRNEQAALPEITKGRRQSVVPIVSNVDYPHANASTKSIENDDCVVLINLETPTSDEIPLAGRMMKRDVCNITFVVPEKFDHVQESKKTSKANDQFTQTSIDDLRNSDYSQSSDLQLSNSRPSFRKRLPQRNRSASMGADPNTIDILAIHSATDAYDTTSSTSAGSYDGNRDSLDKDRNPADPMTIDRNHDRSTTHRNDRVMDGGSYNVDAEEASHKRRSVILKRINQKKAYDRFARRTLQQRTSRGDHTQETTTGTGGGTKQSMFKK